MRKIIFAAFSLAVFSSILFVQFSCTQHEEKKPLTQAEMIALGKYIVHTGGCDDCHTPKIFTERGFIFDTTRSLSGFPNGEVLASIDMDMIKPGNWILGDKHLGAWAGPWGISYASNLTPDKATGIGTLSEEMFIKTLREGKYMGVGRPILPPMPWEVLRLKTDQDLKAIYAYLMSIKPINNLVPQPTPPDKVAELLGKK